MVDTANWGFRKLITIDSTYVDSDLTDYPILVERTNTDMKHTSSGGNVGKTNGGDILFTASDGVTQLKHEVEVYEPTTGRYAAHVKIPSLVNGADTDIYMYYGYAGAADQEDPTNVWDSNFEAVFHLSEDPGPGTAGDIKDSTSNANNATSAASMVTGDLVDGSAGDAIEFDGTDQQVQCQSYKGISGSTNRTFEGCIKTSTVDAAGAQQLIHTGDYTTNGQKYTVRMNGSGEAGTSGALRTEIQGSKYVSNVSLASGSWTHFASILDGTQMGDVDQYVNGTLAGVSSSSNLTRTVATDTGAGGDLLTIGAGNIGSWIYFTGILDEIRISNTNRSAAWVKATYWNLINNPTFTNVGSGAVNPYSVPGNPDQDYYFMTYPDPTVTRDKYANVRNPGGGDVWYKVHDDFIRNTSWDIINELDVDTSWDILNDFTKDTSWDIINDMTRDFSWDILNDFDKDTSWDIINDFVKNASWDILKSFDKNTSWDILNDDTKGTSWDILNDQVKNFSWDILNEFQKDISWKILTGYIDYIQNFVAKYVQTAFIIRKVHTDFNVCPVQSDFTVASIIEDAIKILPLTWPEFKLNSTIQTNFTLRAPIQSNFVITRVNNNRRSTL